MEWMTFKEGKEFFLKSNQSYNTEFGNIDLKEINKIKSGEIKETSKKEKIRFIEPFFIDKYNRMSRGAQLITKKDAGIILAETMVNKNSKVLDCGAGMGGLTCFLANYVKKVYSVDNRIEHIKTAQKNADFLSLKNIEFINSDIKQGIKQKNLDLITLDIPYAEDCLEHCYKALKFGGFLVVYMPHANQMQIVVNQAKKIGFINNKNMEIIQRLWKVEEKILRPENMGLQHTGFLSIMRKT